MNTNFWIVVIGIVLIAAIVMLLSFHSRDKIEVKSVQMYDSPIGPTQNPPYILKSNLIQEVENGVN